MGLFLGDNLAEGGPAVLQAVRCNEVEDGDIFDLLLAVAEGATPGVVDIEELAVRADELDKVMGVFKEGAVPHLAFAQGRLVAASFADVPEEASHAYGLAVLEMGGALAFDYELAAVLGHENGFVAVNIVPGNKLLEDGPARGPALFVDNVQELQLLEIGVTVAQGVFPGLVDIEEGAVRFDAVDEFPGMLNQTLIFFNILLQGQNGPDAVCRLFFQELILLEQVLIAGRSGHK